MPEPTVEKYRLPVMEVIETSREVSQRDISEKTEISLGVVNAVLKDLVRRGWIRAQRVPRKRYAYYLTPQGLTEKTRLALNVFEKTLTAYQQARSLADTRAQAFLARGITQIALQGAGPKLELAYLACLQAGLKIEGIYHQETAGAATLGFTVKRPDSRPADLPVWETGS